MSECNCGLSNGWHDISCPALASVDRAADFHDTRPADIRARANGPWKAQSNFPGKSESCQTRQHVSDGAKSSFEGSQLAQMEAVCRRDGLVILTVAEHDALTANRSNSGAASDTERIKQLEYNLGIAVSMLDEAQKAAIQRGNELIEANTHRFAMVKEIGELKATANADEARGQIDHLDRENAWLRRELKVAHAQRDIAQVEAKGAIDRTKIMHAAYCRAIGRSPSSDVIRVEPFPDVEPRSDSWPPPSHRVRMLP